MLTIHHISFADSNFKNAQSLNCRSALQHGCTSTTAYGPGDIDTDFRKKNDEIFSQKKGAGLWLWKPYLTMKTLNSLEDNEILIYTDAATLFINNVTPLAKLVSVTSPILCFCLKFPEYMYTKRELFEHLDAQKHNKSSQRLASFYVILNCRESREFVDIWLRLSQDKKLIDDTLSLDQEKTFIAHRHDQSIFSLLTKINGYKCYRDPSQYGNDEILSADLYPQIFYHHRGNRLIMWHKHRKEFKNFSKALMDKFKKCKK